MIIGISLIRDQCNQWNKVNRGSDNKKKALLYYSRAYGNILNLLIDILNIQVCTTQGIY